MEGRPDNAKDGHNRPEMPPFSQTELQAISAEISRDYAIHDAAPDVSELVLLEIDPNRLHAYWHVNFDDLSVARLRHGLPNAPLALQLYDITDLAVGERPVAPTQTAPVGGLDGSLYMESLEGDHVYILDLGLVREDQTLMVFAHSNPIRLPRNGESTQYEFIPVDVNRRGSTPPTPSDAQREESGPLNLDEVEIGRIASSASVPQPDGGTAGCRKGI